MKQRLSRVETLFRDGAVGQAIPNKETDEPGTDGDVHATRKSPSMPASIGESSEGSKSQIGAKQIRHLRHGVAD
jgi:hypothetical protein